MLNQLRTGLLMMLIMTIVTGLLYPLAVTGLAQGLFRDKANGSLLTRNGQVVGSSLIAQKFTRPEYFQPRPSAAGNDGFDATASGGSNLGPTSKKLVDRVKASADKFRLENPGFTAPLPADLVTASGSGLDPHISPASAEAQVARVARTRGVTDHEVRAVMAARIETPDLGFIGEPRVNVLLLNLDLDTRFPLRR